MENALFLQSGRGKKEEKKMFLAFAVSKRKRSFQAQMSVKRGCFPSWRRLINMSSFIVLSEDPVEVRGGLLTLRSPFTLGGNSAGTTFSDVGISSQQKTKSLTLVSRSQNFSLMYIKK